eukprot:TRINITY_DN638_c0_g1_i1.p2 TRINITY_DN638_c0_g1~~TRINITY_DN638_c0_g1_i1.p2  ORF type:complete len:366 (-),score=94.93 TRINITY_DN638_c0_g1_i1:49-1044(-)
MGGALSSDRAPHDYTWVATDEPHATRRRQILEAHPEIEKLYGPDIRTFPVVVFMVLSQIFLAIALRETSWWIIAPILYCYGATVNHSLSLAVHEISHNLVFQSPKLNRALGFFANLPQGVASSITFRRYHLEHHMYQGVMGIDMDIASRFEGAYFSSPLMKLVWLFLQPLWYALRPLILAPKKAGAGEILNWIVVLAFDASLVYFYGWKPLVYLLLCNLIGHGVHPVAGHFIAEHFIFTPGYETFSYYGPLNLVTFNVGYHNEHHDFPKIAGWKLPQVKAMAPEFYDNLPCYTSWTAVLWNYVTKPNVGPYSRAVRSEKYSKALKEKATTD